VEEAKNLYPVRKESSMFKYSYSYCECGLTFTEKTKNGKCKCGAWTTDVYLPEKKVSKND
jgi:hypothetical protein